MSKAIANTPVGHALPPAPFSPVVVRVGSVDEIRDRPILDISPASIKKAAEFPDGFRSRECTRPVSEQKAAESARERLAAMRGTVIVGDILAPIEDVEWTADADNL
ncbi:MAG: hypothetical protein HQL87_09665 [Magnetococcales bacterium]|nr:hypothetical protein [Magnetococcales bacterium]